MAFFLLAPWSDGPLFGGGRIIAAGPYATAVGRTADAPARMEVFSFGGPTAVMDLRELLDCMPDYTDRDAVLAGTSISRPP